MRKTKTIILKKDIPFIGGSAHDSIRIERNGKGVERVTSSFSFGSYSCRKVYSKNDDGTYNLLYMVNENREKYRGKRLGRTIEFEDLPADMKYLFSVSPLDDLIGSYAISNLVEMGYNEIIKQE